MTGSKSEAESVRRSKVSDAMPGSTATAPAARRSDHDSSPTSNAIDPGDARSRRALPSAAKCAGTYSPKKRAGERGMSLMINWARVRTGRPKLRLFHELAQDVRLEHAEQAELHAETTRFDPAHHGRQSEIL